MPAKAKQAASDSPPVELVPARRSLKRTASTASLLTPPRTVKKSTRVRSRGSAFETDEDDSDYGGASKGKVLFAGNKRRRTGLDALASAIAGSKSADPLEVAEDAFWMGDGGRAIGGPLGTILESPPDLPPTRSEQDDAPSKVPSPAKAGSSTKKKGPTSKASATKKARSPTKAAPRSKEAKETSRPPSVQVRAPLSPPPSRRRTQTVKRTLPLVAPVTPPRRSTRVVSNGKAPTPGPVRDSGNNPFLTESDDSAVEASPVMPRTPRKHVEKATLTYVFRGVKTTFANPLFNVDPEEHALSLLPPDHPDFEPTELCPPRLLFPQVQRKQPARRAKAALVPPTTPPRIPRTPSPRRRTHDDSDDDALPVVPSKLLFPVAGSDRRTRSGGRSAGRSVNPDALLKATGPSRSPVRRSPRRAH